MYVTENEESCEFLIDCSFWHEVYKTKFCREKFPHDGKFVHETECPNFQSMTFFAKSYKKYVCLFFAQKIVSINMSESSLNVRAKKTWWNNWGLQRTFFSVKLYLALQLLAV